MGDLKIIGRTGKGNAGFSQLTRDSGTEQCFQAAKTMLQLAYV